MKRIDIALRAGAALTVLAIATSAAAQSTLPPPDAEQTPASTAEEPTPGGDIVVTGSRIRRDPLSQEQPIVFVDEEDIAKTGLNSINDVLQRLPSSGGGLNSKINNSGNIGNPPDGGGVGAGSAEIDLRYLGSRRVLVLVDGIRYVNGASASGVPGSTDLNSITESSIERIEVLQDGASAIYGSDAIAGVVNVITKRRQDGFEASAQWGGYDVGDGFTQNYQLSWGNGSAGPLELVVGGNYVDQGSVRTSDRSLTRFPLPYSNSCADLPVQCSGFIAMGRFNVPGIFGPGPANVQTVIATTNTPTRANFRPYQDPADRFNFGPFNFLQIPLERFGAFGHAKYELADDLNFSLKGNWNRRKSKNMAAPLPFAIGRQAGISPVLNSVTVHVTNPFNPFGVTLDASNMNVIARRFLEGGPRLFSQTVDTIYGVATLDGRLNLGAKTWFWDVNAAYGRNKAKQTMVGNINSSHLRQALGPVADCVGRPGQFGGTCVPFNIFGGAGSITQEMLNFVMFEQNDSSEQKLLDLTANLSGNLFELPGGPLGVAMGLEYRKLRGRFDPDPVVAAGFSSDQPGLPTKGSYDVKEAYAEISAPLLADLPFVDLLEVTGAVRFSDYSRGIGSATTLKGGVNWKPIEDLRLRGSWGQGFRAPQIGELFGTASRFDQTLSDPCSNNSTQTRNFNNDATVRANCIAAGVPGDGSYRQSNPQISVNTGGNPDLQPETSESWVIGGVYSPRFLPGLSLEANWYKIKVKDAIQAINATTTLNNCVATNDPATCALVTRVAGEVTEITGVLQNIAAIKTHGYDVNLAYRNIQTGFGKFGLTWNNSILRNFDVFAPGPAGIQKISREGTEQGAPSQAFPKWKSIGILDWDLANFGATVTGRYVSKLKDTGFANATIKSIFYTDLQLRWFAPSFADNFGFALGVNNLFDKKAPGCVGCETNNLAVSVHDVPGRYVYARASVKM